MNKPAVQRQSRPLLPELLGLFTGWPTFAGWRPFFDNHALRLEEETRDGFFLVRAEVPGVDPIEDLEVTLRDGRLAIKSERRASGETNGRSEFVYGTFERTVALPAGADEDDVHATYDRGILTVLMPLSDDESAAKHVEVIETMLVEAEDDDDGDYAAEDDDAVSAALEQQEQPVG